MFDVPGAFMSFFESREIGLPFSKCATILLKSEYQAASYKLKMM